jgi:hypothetical protein
MLNNTQKSRRALKAARRRWVSLNPKKTPKGEKGLDAFSVILPNWRVQVVLKDSTST